VDVESRSVRPDPVEIDEARWWDPAAPPAALGSMVRQALMLAGLARPQGR
jgi:hypothetical protein